ncbi:2,3-dihydro-2,3-dihydroxybenzoate dehydrogenase [uncultured Castellaniella sp.]|mgnify:CR=1 FL=1|uniref:2,3-dihydro-2,3-dihydroxybenzoate dehydrogenase n=1 Tax=uncultured Castellaniella sp. TaxID=647907 RepID=UPI002602C2F9|nr:2,3-dihydro-2,3-dihydroxybenzoate dehydrogenase [uncultured Castellaniella sp.]
MIQIPSADRPVSVPAPGTGHAPRSGFEDRHILVTGAAGGIGAAVALQLLARGARVSAVDLRADGLETLQAAAAAQAPADEQPRLWTARLDVRNAAQVEDIVAQAQAALGPHDGLASVAGVLEMGDVVDLDDAQWQRCFDINATGVFHVCRAVARRLRERRAGAIVTVSSNAAATPRAGMAAYAASKAAVTQFSRCLGLELAPYGIRVNIVSPGSTDTAMQQAMWALGSSRETVIRGDAARWRLGIPLDKIATPDEIAACVLFLLSDQASHITLHDLRVDGGATLDQG